MRTQAQIDRGLQIARSITENPEEWDNGSWGHKNQCGTSLCFAGTGAYQDGLVTFGSLTNGRTSFLQYTEDGRALAPEHQFLSPGYVSLDWYGLDVLGLTYEEVDYLFHWDPDGGSHEENLGQLWGRLQKIYGDDIEVPEGIVVGGLDDDIEDSW